MKKTADRRYFRSPTPRRAIAAALLLCGALLVVSRLFPAADRPLSGSVVFVLSPPNSGPERSGSCYAESSRLLLWDPSRERLHHLSPGLVPTGPPRISFDGGDILFSAREEKGGPSQIWEMDSDGSDLRRLTDGSMDCLTPEYLSDGRIVFAREMRVDAEEVFSLFVLDPSSAVLEQITFNRDRMIVKGLAEDGRILLERSEGNAEPARLLAVRPDGTELDEFLPASSKDGPVLHPGGSRSPEPLVSRPESDIAENVWPVGWEVRDAVRIEPGPRPPVSTSVVDSDLDHAWLLCLDVSRSDGANIAGSRQVRVLDARGDAVLGTAPIESDGSFFLKVPADRLMRLELVDARGTTLARQRHGFWVRPNERRGCVGCHEPRYMAPENRVPLAVMKPAFEIAAPRDTVPGNSNGEAP